MNDKVEFIIRKEDEYSNSFHQELRPGDRVFVRQFSMLPNMGLSYPAFYGIMKEEGTTGGWDVYDIVLANGKEVSVYGFSIVKEKP